MRPRHLPRRDLLASARLPLAIATTVTLLAASPAAVAFNPYKAEQCTRDGEPFGAVWSSDELPVPYAVHQGGYSGLELSTVRQVIADGWGVWSEPCCSGWAATETGTTSATAVDSPSENVFSFEESSWPAWAGDPEATLAVTLPAVAPDWETGCTIVGADILYNAVDHTWVDDRAPNVAVGEIDLLQVTIHEQGHWLGLDHSDVFTSTMWFGYIGPTGGLHQDDVDGVCFLYERSCTCVTDDDCNAGRECTDGQCVVPPCTSDDDCQSPLICDTEGGECEDPPCERDDDCGIGYVCDTGECFPGGECRICQKCTTNADCGPGGLCLLGPEGDYFCTQACSSDGLCPGNSSCVIVSTGDDLELHLCLNLRANEALCPDDFECGLLETCPHLGHDCTDNLDLCSDANDLCVTGVDEGPISVCSCSCTRDAQCQPDGPIAGRCAELPDGSRACVLEYMVPECGGVCPEDTICDLDSGDCVEDPGPGPGEGCPDLGGACGEQGTSCTSDEPVCVNETGEIDHGPDGFCSCFCQSDSDCEPDGYCDSSGGAIRPAVCLPSPCPPCGPNQRCDPVTVTCVDAPPGDEPTEDTAGSDDRGFPDVGGGEDAPGDNAAGGDAGGADEAEPAASGAARGDDSGCGCGTVSSERRGPATWPIWLGLTAGLLGLGPVWRRRRRKA